MLEAHRGQQNGANPLNVLNTKADDIQYAYASRLRGETSDGVDDVHSHTAERGNSGSLRGIGSNHPSTTTWPAWVRARK